MSKDKKGLRINEKIRVPQVRLVDENNNQAGIVERNEALNRARETGLDLVEVAPTSNPPVCRIMDYGKFLYQQKRKLRDSHKKHKVHSTTLKEIRLRPEIEQHDLDIKINHAREFIEKGHKVQFTIMFRGREILHQERGYEIFQSIKESMEDIAKAEKSPRMSNRRITMTIISNK
ncbi:MAG: translation initiation factor IF-3 [Sedimentisphaerales bacterium]|nr:translation initiation factor IF-3 [Sedimentisphaerales bacterium]